MTSGGAAPMNAGDAAVTLCDVRLAQAWNVRGDPANAAFLQQARASFGMALPTQPNTTAANGGQALLWLGPRSWLWLCDTGAAQFGSTRAAINAAGGALFDVSASYVAWRVSGDAAERVLNRTCPLDLHPRAFPAGSCAQSLVGHINAIFYRTAIGNAFTVLVARSLAQDARDHLAASASTEGCALGVAVGLDAMS